MRKLKKINGYLVVRFNDREKREYEGTGLGNFGVIDAELYTGILDVDRSVMEYDDIETLEIALEQARGLESELDVVEPEVKITVIIEGETEVSEEDVEPESLFKGQRATLEAQLKHGPHLDLDPLTAAHELHGYAKALEDLGMIDGHDERFMVERNTFGEVCNLYTDEGHRVNVALPSRAGLAIMSPHDFEEGDTFTGCTVQTLKCRRCGMESFAWSKEPSPGQEETLAYICDEVCKYREGRTQEELDAICEKCKVDRWAGAPPTLTPQEVQAELDADQDNTPLKETFTNLPDEFKNERVTRKVYALGLALGEDSPGNDCIVYRNIFGIARELDDAIDKLDSAAAQAALRRELWERVKELREMYLENYAVQQYKEGMQE